MAQLAAKVDMLNEAFADGEDAGLLPRGIRVIPLTERRGRLDYVAIHGDGLADFKALARLRAYVSGHLPGCVLKHEAIAQRAGTASWGPARWRTFVGVPDERPRPRHFRFSYVRDDRFPGVYDVWHDSRWDVIVAALCTAIIAYSVAALWIHWSGYSDPLAPLRDWSYCTMLLDRIDGRLAYGLRFVLY